MRKKLVALPLAAVVLAVVFAGAPGVAAGKGKPPRAGVGCRPQVAFVFEGIVSAVSEGSFSLDVDLANRHARSLVGRSATVNVGAATRVVRDGAPATLADLSEGDAVNVQVRACKGANPTTMTLAAHRVVATSPVEEPIVDEPVA